MPAQTRLLEQIKYHTELMRFMWIFLLAVGGGSTSVLYRNPASWSSRAVVVGWTSELLAVVLFGYLDRRVRRFIHQLGEG